MLTLIENCVFCQECNEDYNSTSVRREAHHVVETVPVGKLMIYFMTFDSSKPNGGTRLMYETVDTLNEVGFPSRIWQIRGLEFYNVITVVFFGAKI